MSRTDPPLLTAYGKDKQIKLCGGKRLGKRVVFFRSEGGEDGCKHFALAFPGCLSWLLDFIRLRHRVMTCPPRQPRGKPRGE